MIKKITELKYELLIIFLFVLFRLPSLGHDVFNTDVWKWKQRSYDFGTGVFTLDFEKTLQKYHPGVTLMWIGSVGVKINNLYTDIDPGFGYFSGADVEINRIFQLHFVQKLVLVIVLGISLSFVFYPLRKLFGAGYALLAFLLLSLEPFYLALTRVFHLEGLLATFMLASVIWLFYAFQDQTRVRRFYLSAFFGALAVLTKSTALYLLPFVGLMLFLFYYRDQHNLFSAIKKSLNPYLMWILGFLLVFVVLWPVLWVNPLEALSTMYRGVFVIGVERDHVQYFFGKLVNNPGVFYYPVVFVLRSSIYLLGGIIGYLLLGNKNNKLEKDFTLYLFLYAILYAVLLTVPSKKLDRYILPSISSLTLVAALFFYRVLNEIDLKKRLKYPALLFPALLYLFMIHPDYLSYYNPVFGGLKTGIRVIEPKWMIGTKEITKYFRQEKQKLGLQSSYGASFEGLIDTGDVENVLSVGFQEKYYTQIWPFFREFGSWAVVKDLTNFAKDTNYFVYPVWDDDSNNEDRFDIEYVDDIKVQGVSVYRVYERISD